MTRFTPTTADGKRAMTIVAYSVMALVSLVMRMVKLDYSDNGTPVFDEKHYAPQAQQMLLNGGIEDNPGYGLVVHPPLGKFLISIGEFFFGYTPLGWRLTAVLAGVAIVLLVMAMIHRITGNIGWALLAGLLLNIEGTTLVMSRIGMLDIFLCLMVTLTATFVLFDMTGDHTGVPWHRRWLLLAAGICSGLAMAIKISGVYYPAAIGIILVIAVAIKSKNVRETAKALGMGLVFFAVIPLVVFALSWTPWFADTSSVYRHAAESGNLDHKLPSWLADMFGDSINSFASYQIGILKFHTSLTTSAGNVHPWESKPWEWLYDTRPMLFWDQTKMLGADGTMQKIYLIGNPSIWLLLVPVFVLALIAMFAFKSKTWGFVVAGLAVGYFPWLASWDRQMYFFYVLPMVPFLVMGLVLIMRGVSKVLTNKTPLPQWASVSIATAPYTLFALVVFGMYTPWMYGTVTSVDHNNTLTLFKQAWAARQKH